MMPARYAQSTSRTDALLQALDAEFREPTHHVMQIRVNAPKLDSLFGGKSFPVSVARDVELVLHDS
jgi:hypothetical protein